MLTSNFKPLLLKRWGGGGVNSVNTVDVTVNSKEETLKTFVPITPKNSASVYCVHITECYTVLSMHNFIQFLKINHGLLCLQELLI
jgi:hypothetical protein